MGMSVTFSLPNIPSLIRTGPHSLVECMEFERAMGENCDLCSYTDGPGVNLSNGNAMTLMAAIGVEDFDYYGSLPVAEFKGYLLVGLALVDDTAIADTVDKFPGGATMIDCGTPEGYRSRRLTELLDLCTQAESLGLDTIEWG